MYKDIEIHSNFKVRINGFFSLLNIIFETKTSF